MKKLVIGVGLVLGGLMLLCTDYIVTSVIGAMPGVTLVDGVAVFSLPVVGWILMGAGTALAVFGCNRG